MEKNIEPEIHFVIPGDTSVVDVIYEILTNNQLPETPSEKFQKTIVGVESRFRIIRDASLVLAAKKAPENKIVELLSSHLGTSPETAQKILADIKQKLIPYAKRISDEEPKREPVKPAAPPAPAPKLPYSKEIEIKNVEENAKNMIKSEELRKVKTVIPQQNNRPASSEPDTYREPIE